MKGIIKNKKGQEEMVGFVMVMVLVVVIFLVFLGITLRNPKSTERKSEAIYQFLDSLMEQTTECALNAGTNYLTLDDLIRECRSANSECLDGESSCDALGRTLIEAVNKSWKAGPDYPYKGYEMRAIYMPDATGSQPGEEVFLLSAGNCTGSIVGNSYWIPDFPGSITATLKLCI